MTLEVSHPNNTDTDFRKPFQPLLCHVLLRPPSHVLMFIASARHTVVFRISGHFRMILVRSLRGLEEHRSLTYVWHVSNSILY